LKKAELKERLAAIRKAFDKELKDKEALANKLVSAICVETKQQWSYSFMNRLFNSFRNTSKTPKTLTFTLLL
jgi:trehalose-6-phosphate synthase